MAQITGVFRIGKDAELRRIPSSGDAVINLALAANYGRKDSEGKRPTQWVEASLFGKLAEALAQYLVKGAQVYCVISDPHIETFQGHKGEGFKLVGRIIEIELVGGRRDDAAPRQAAPERQTAPRQQATPKASSGFDDLDDDSSIPF